VRGAPLRLVIRAFLTGLAAVYASAFLSLAVQVDGLFGSRGIAPAALLLARTRELRGSAAWLERPTLLWLGASDGALHALCAAGVALAAALAAGIAPRLALAGLWALYLSLVSIGGIFLRYQWDALLLETGLLAVFVAPGGWLPFRRPWTPPHPLAIWLPRFLLFKLMFLSGAAKLLSGDPTWRGLTALRFHFETQPLPTWSSWLAHELPDALQRATTLATLAIEFGVPWLVFAGRRGRLVACAAFAGLQLVIAATGNYGFFNLLTLALCVTLLDDATLARCLPERLREAVLRPEAASASAADAAGVAARAPAAVAPRTTLPARARRAAFGVAAGGLLLVSALSLLDRLGLALPRPGALFALQRRLAPFQVASAYGLFAVMTTERPEIEILGTDDGRTWRTYVFRYKPGPLERAPRFAPLHLPRLDWQMWFAALDRCQDSPWLAGLFTRLLEGEPRVLELFAGNPFPERPPRFLRTDLYRYRFAPPGERAWWRREPLGRFCPVVELAQGRLAPAAER
jgi:hypothetical protein